MVEVTETPFPVTRGSGQVLDGFITTTSSITNKLMMVWMHGTLSEYNHNFTTDLATKLAKDFGISSFRYDSRFSQTEKEPNHRYRFSGFEDDIDDMKNVIKALKNEGYGVWALLGHSRGANDALIYASRYNFSLSASSSPCA